MNKTKKILRKLFKRKKKEKPKSSIPKKWKQKKPEQPKEEERIYTTTEHKKIKIPFFRTIKRIVATILFFISSVLGLVSAHNPTFSMSLYFLAVAYICLDYLWKTRHPKEVIYVPEKWRKNHD